jgi:hypothetical protein
MKNIHVLPTDKPSRLFKFANELHLDTIPKDYYKKYNIYITSDEEIKEGDWVVKISSLYKGGGNVQKYSFIDSQFEDITFKKIILTTDQDLIADGVQSIDGEFLEWFIQNPSYEFVKVRKRFSEFTVEPFVGYEIIIPKEEPKYIEDEFEMQSRIINKVWDENEPKQETLEQAAGNLADPNICKTDNWIAGANWMAERMYSEEEVKRILMKTGNYTKISLDAWFEQFKKK